MVSKSNRSRASSRPQKRSPSRERRRSPVRRSTARLVGEKSSWLTRPPTYEYSSTAGRHCLTWPQPIYSCYDLGDSSPSHVNPTLCSTLNSSQMFDNFTATLNSLSFHDLEMPYSYDTSTSQFVNNQRPSTETVNPQNTLTQESQQRCSSPSSNLNGIAQSINSTDEWGDWIDSVLIDQHGDRAREALRKQSHDQPTNAPVQDNSINSNFSVGSSDNRSHERSAVESPQPKKHEERRKRKRSKSRSVERSRSPSLERAKRPCTEADSLNDSSNKTPESSSEANEMETSMSETSTEPMVIETLKKDVELQFVQWHVEEPTVQVQEPLTAARRVESHSSLEEGEIHEDSDEATKTTSQKVIEENVIEISDSDTEETETIESDDDIVFLKEVKADCAPISTHEHVKQEPAPTVEASAQSTIQPSAPSCIESNVEVALEIVRKPILESSFIASAEVSLGIAVEASVDSTVEPALEMPTESNVESHELDITNPNHMAMSEEQSSTLTPANESEESLHLFRYFPEFLDLDGELEQQVSGEEMTTASPLSNIFRNTEIYNENELTDRPIIEEVSLDALSDTEIQWTSEVNSNETQSETQTEVAAHFMDYRVSSYVEFVVPEENNSAVQFNVSAPPRPQPIYLKMPRLAQQEVITLEDDEPIFSHSTSSTSTNVNQRLDLPRNHSRFSPRVQPKVFVSNFVDYRKNSLMSALADKMIVFYDYSEFRSQYADLPIDYWRIDDVCSILLLRTNDPNFVHPNLPISIYRTTTIRYELPPSQSRLSFVFIYAKSMNDLSNRMLSELNEHLTFGELIAEVVGSLNVETLVIATEGSKRELQNYNLNLEHMMFV